MMKVVRLVRCTDLLVNVTGCSARGLSGRTGVGGSGLSGGLAHRLWNKPNWGQLRGTQNCFAFFFFFFTFRCQRKLLSLFVSDLSVNLREIGVRHRSQLFLQFLTMLRFFAFSHSIS